MALTKIPGELFDADDLDLSDVGTIALDAIKGEADTDTSITFSGSNVITVKANNANQVTFIDGAIVPSTDNDIDLGTSSVEFKDAFFDGTVTSDAFAGPLTGNVTGDVSGSSGSTTGNAATATALATARTIGGVSFDGSANINLPGVNAAGTQTSTGLTGSPNITVGTIGSGNITTTGYLAGPASFVIDPATVGDDTGTVVIAGGLQVDGTTTTINSTTLTVDDLNVVLASGAANSAAANGAGITIDGASATMLYTHATTSFDFNKPVNVTGAFSASGAITGTLATAAQTNITSLGTLTTLTVDDITINGSTISDGADLTLDVAASITLDSDSGVIDFDDGGTNIGRFENASSDFKMESRVQDKDIVLVGNDGGTGIEALRLDMSEGGTAIFHSLGTSSLTRLATFTSSGSIRKFHIDGTETSGNTIDVNFVKDINGTESSLLYLKDGDVGIGTNDPSTILHLKETGSTSAVNEFLRLENSAGGGTGAGSSINFHHYHSGGGPAGGAKAAAITAVNTENWAGGTPSNYSTDLTFGNINANTFAEKMRITSEGNVGIGTTSPTHSLHVLTTDAKGFLLDRNSGSNAANLNEFSTHYSLSIKTRANGSYLNFAGDAAYSALQATDGAGSATAKNLHLNPWGGNVGIGTGVSTPAADLHVYSTSNPEIRIGTDEGSSIMQMAFSDGSGYFLRMGDAANNEDVMIRTYGNSHFNGGNVGIGTTSPSKVLHVSAGGTNVGAVDYDVAIFQNSDAAGIRLVDAGDGGGNGGHAGFGNDNGNLRTSAAGILTFATGLSTSNSLFNGGTERMRIDSSGHLQVADGGIIKTKTTTGEVIRFERSSDTNRYSSIYANSTDGGGAYIQFKVHDGSTATSLSNTMTLKGSGYVGIDETDPVKKLVVAGGSGPDATIMVHMDADTAGGECGLYFKADSTNTDVRQKASIIFRRDDPGTRGTGNLHFCVNGDNNDVNAGTSHSRAAILSGGDFVVGTTTAPASMYNGVSGSGFGASTAGWATCVRAGTNTPLYVSTNSQGSGGFISFSQNGATRGDITYTGSAVAYNTSSDYRLKENVVTDWNATTRLKQLKPSQFNFIETPDTTVEGFLAHEVSSIVPQAITGEKDELYTAENSPEEMADLIGEPKYQVIDQSKLVPLMVKTIQELEARITELEDN